MRDVLARCATRFAEGKFTLEELLEKSLSSESEPASELLDPASSGVFVDSSFVDRQEYTAHAHIHSHVSCELSSVHEIINMAAGSTDVVVGDEVVVGGLIPTCANAAVVVEVCSQEGTLPPERVLLNLDQDQHPTSTPSTLYAVAAAAGASAANTAVTNNIVESVHVTRTGNLAKDIQQAYKLLMGSM
jgi:hypothetical protein